MMKSPKLLVFSIGLAVFGGGLFSAPAAVYYVNDGSTNGNVYTTAVGNDANAGTSPATPKRTVTNLLASVSLVAGDVVYIDTGVHSNYSVFVGVSGASGNPIRFIGSTNWAAGGTRFVRNNTAANGFNVTGQHLSFAHLRVLGGLNGFRFTANNNELDSVYVYSNASSAVEFSFANNQVVRRSVFAWNPTGIRYNSNNPGNQPVHVTHSVFWENVIAVDAIAQSGQAPIITVTNSVISYVSAAGRAYSLSGGARVFSDYNAICRRGAATILAVNTFTGVTSYRLSDWQQSQGVDLFSVCTGESRFANPDLLDFHPRSITGRYDPFTGNRVTDTVHSVLIDFGPVGVSFANEPAPNGGRVNIGLYGDTGEASMSQTNPWLQAVSFSDGGLITATGVLYWTYGAFTNGSTVRLSYSHDNGATWTNVAVGVSVTNTPYPWVVTGRVPSLQARWRVQGESLPAVLSTNRQVFTLRATTNSVFSLFVNDSSTTGDVFCSAIGSTNFLGLSASQPAASIQQVYNEVNIGPGDTIYVDTGIYTGALASVILDASKNGLPGQAIRIVGSHNAAAGGTVLDRGGASLDAVELQTRHIELRRLRVQNARYAFLFTGAADNLVAESMALNSVNGFRGNNTSVSNRFQNCIAAHNTIGVALFGNGNWWERGVAWSNNTAFSLTSANSMSVSNSVIAHGVSFGGAGITIAGDYNVFWNASIPGYATLNELQKVTGGWWNSTYGEPLFADPAQRDFHPRSTGGRFDPGAGHYVTSDVQTSLLVDFGNPADPAFALEPAPNGGRINASPYGGTAEASKSPTNAWLRALTYNDGGQLSIPDDVTYWTFGNLSTGATVRIEYSGDGGATWNIIATNIAASAGSHTWTTTNYPSSRFARWRVVLEANPLVTGANITNFTFRNGPYVYYVNDGSQAGDVYTTAPGDNANLGTTPGAPRASLASILASYVMDPGDIIYVDTGTYSSDAPITFTQIHSGSTNAPVRVVGSTNAVAGGSLVRNLTTGGLATDGVIVSNNVQNLDISHLRITGRRHGIQLTSAQRVRLIHVRLYNNASTGIRMTGGGNHVIANSAVYDNPTGMEVGGATNVMVGNSVLWNNGTWAVNALAGTVSISNSVLGASGLTAGIYTMPTSLAVRANFNNYVLRNHAIVAQITGVNRLIDTLSSWQAESGQDTRSLNVEPLFADEESRDFHLKTEAVEGRFLPGVGWVSDTVTSPLIDAGAPSASFALEPAPNGGRVNIGKYGNSAQASIGRATPWIEVVSLAGGGWVRGTTTLAWVHGSLASTNLVRVELSPDGGESWSVLHTGISVNAESYAWNTTTTNNVVAGLWRIGVLGSPALSRQTTNFFVIRNGPVAWYVNDAATAGDVYCSGPGMATNWVATPARPLRDLSAVFERYDVEPGDVVYVDTGVYPNQSPVVIGRTRGGGVTSTPVRIVGSTNCAGNATQLGFFGGIGMDIGDLTWLQISNLSISGASTGVRIQRSRNVDMTLTRVVGCGSTAVLLNGTTNVVLRRMVLAYNAGFAVAGGNNQNIAILQGVAWSNQAGAISFSQSSSIAVSNTVLTASGPTNYLFILDNVAGFRSDFNNVLLEGGASMARVNNQIRKLLTSWQSAATNDARSLSHPPLFVDPANGDFHLRSEAGRYDTATCLFVNDAETSPMIDAGLKTAPFGLESDPNGGRINLGLYGNHPRASRTPTNPALIAVSYYTGGIIRGTNDLYWLARGAATGHTVRVEYSSDGQTWNALATNVPASAEQYLGWDTTTNGSLPVVWWRVISEQESGVIGSNAVAFTINNGSISYFVNDASTDGDVYTTAPGQADFDGLSPASPLPSLNEVLARYPLQEGDLVYIDTGVYSTGGTALFDANIKGSPTNFIQIIGSTNLAAGGTIINGLRSGPYLTFIATENFRVANLRFTNSSRAVLMIGLTNAVFENVEIVYPENLAPFGDRYGFRIEQGSSITMNRLVVSDLTNQINSWSVFATQSTNLYLNNSVLWSNNVGLLLGGQSSLRMSNSVIGVFGRGRIGVSGASAFTGDHNAIHARNGAYPFVDSAVISTNPPGLFAPIRYRTVVEWQQQLGLGSFTLSHAPLFSEAEEGRFYLKSQAGRYQPFTQTWVFDTVNSPLIDSGNPATAFENEPAPNGDRVNIGRHGNTEWASRSATTSGYYTVLSFNDGGVAQGTNVVLRWISHGVVTNTDHPVRIQYSDSGGVFWSDLVAGLPATNRQWAWNSMASGSSLNARWRIHSELTPSYEGRTEELFALRNSPFVFYVNDGMTTGDVYTVTAGHPTNSGLSANAPLPHLADVFARYDIEPGDTIYVDTGVYAITNQLTIRQEDAGRPDNHVTIIGSTNRSAGGTRFTGGTLLLDSTRGITVRNIIMDNSATKAGTLIRITQATNTVMEAVDSIGGAIGFHVDRSSDVRFLNCSVRNASTNGLLNDQANAIVWNHGLLWSNRVAVQGLSRLVISNSVLGAFGEDAVVYAGGGGLVADYNAIQVGHGAYVARLTVANQTFPRLYESVGRWSQETGNDRYSLAHPPLFINAPAGDFHLRSTAGRFDPTAGIFVFDGETSPLVDAAGPADPHDRETPPNGGRANIGRFGNTPEASRTPTNPVLFALSFYDGGVARGTNVMLTWLAQGGATSHAVRLEFSADNGGSWVALASNLPPGSSSFTWDSSLLPSTVLARWRVISEANSNITGSVGAVFAVRNGPVNFYVNDASTTGDVYTTAVGSPLNTGAFPHDPKNSIRDVFITYELEPGDVIYADTGLYTLTQPIEITSLDAGSTNTFPVTVFGSTNALAGGTVLNAGSLAAGISVLNAQAIHLKHLIVQNGQVGISFNNSPAFDLEFVTVRNSDIGISVGNASHGGRFRNCVIRDVAGSALGLAAVQNISWNHGILWSNGMNRSHAISLRACSVGFSNSVFVQFGTNAVYSWGQEDVSLQSDHNFFQLSEKALVSVASSTGAPLPMLSANVSRWVRDYGKDRNSLSGDPLFADPAQGDFHPRSQAGRYHPLSGTFVADTNTSLLIDSGAPFSNFSAESQPNGSRANIGLYGNTPFASRSPSTPRLAAASLRDGGRVEGQNVPMIWRAYGAATGHTVRLEYSGDGGAAWVGIATNIPARTESIFWNPINYTSTWLGVWRVVSEVDPAVIGMVEKPFAVRNTGLPLFINDTATNGLVYSTAPGSPFNDGLSPATPRLTLQSVLDDYDLEPGDTIYMDTGNYNIGDTISWGRMDGWEPITNLVALQQGAAGVTLQGSTNELAGGTRILRFNQGVALALNQAYGIAIRNIRFGNLPVRTGSAITLSESPYSRIEWVRASDAGLGIQVSRSDDAVIRHTVVSGTQTGLVVSLSSNVVFRNGVLWSNDIGVRVSGEQTALRVDNSVVGALQATHTAYERDDSFTPRPALSSDYNVLFIATNAFVGRLRGPYPGGELPLLRLVRWQERTSQDTNSLVANPLFANPAAGDFHPQSPHGRFVPGVGHVTSSEPLSPLVDGGQPSADFLQEPPYNGLRMNVGLYGNTEQASKSPTNGVLRALTFNDGGSGFDDIWLRWSASGPAAGHTALIEFSSDGGVTWQTVVSNYPAAAEAYLWNSAPFGRAAAGVWRITSQIDSNLTSRNQRFFSLRQDGTVPYFVNDASTVGDVYTTAPGSDNNSGFLPSDPKATLQALINDVELEPGDVVYIDTGTYADNKDTLIGTLDAGAPANPVIFRGSTNIAAGGSVIDRITGVGSGISILKTEGIRLENLIVQNAGVGISVSESESIDMVGMTARNNTLVGVISSGSRSVTLRNSVVNNNGVGVSAARAQESGGELTVLSSVIWGNPIAAGIAQSCSMRLTNSVLHAFGQFGRIYSLGIGVSDVVANYNNYLRESGALMAERQVQSGGNEFVPRLLDWQRFLGQDRQSLSHAPLFADTGNGDFHPRSSAGRFTMAGVLTNDPPSINSPLIDAGDPSAAFSAELSPNGARVNIGRYGNTAQASLSRTNPWLMAASVNDGGRVSGTQLLYWVAGNLAPTNTVRLEVANNGVDYSIIASNVPAVSSGYVWDASGEPVTQLARWRVILEGNESVNDAVDNPFIIKNETIIVYVNDAGTAGDVYTFAIGSATNTGLSKFAPLDNPVDAFDRYPFGPGDVMYIDTGVYPIPSQNGMQIGLIGDVLKSGFPGLPITIQGSTNRLAGGSLLQGTGDNNALVTITQTKDIELFDLRFRNSGAGLRILDSERVTLARVEASENTNGFVFASAADVDVTRAASYRNKSWGFLISGAESDVRIASSVMSSNTAGALAIGAQSRVTINRSILDVSSSNAVAYSVVNQSSLGGDFNVIWPGDNKVIARNNTTTVNYSNLRSWQRDRNMDHFSVILDPLFADPESGDFHLRSSAGRYIPASHAFIADGQTSWAIDAAGFTDPFNLETDPNGGRANIGLYGNTPEASRSITNPAQAEVLVISLSDGGTVAGSHPLYWLYRGLASNELVRLEYSPNDGLVWTTIANNLPVGNNYFQWNFAELESTPLALWRITVLSNPSITDRTDTNFTIRNGPILYYVNDTNIAGNVFTTVPGSPLNNGITPSTAVHSVSAVLERYDLDGGDVVYVDTGLYIITNNIRILASNGGEATNRVVIHGSPNRQAGGTIFRRVDTNAVYSATNLVAAFEFFATSFIELNQLTIEQADVGVAVVSPVPVSGGHLLRNVLIRDGGSAGVLLNASTGNRLDRVVITRHQGVEGTTALALNNASAVMENSIIWSNAGSTVSLNQGNITVSNSVLHTMDAITNVIYQIGASSAVVSDFNNLLVSRGASYAQDESGFLYTGLPQWNQGTQQDRHSLAVDPLFIDPANDDYHLISATGRYDPLADGFVISGTNYSWLIDNGAFASTFTNEPMPNGGRRNIGRYGDTPEASKSRTNAWLLAVTAMSGGRMGGFVELFWSYGNLDATNRVQLDYSPDGGTNWIVIAQNVPIAQDGLFWDSLSFDPPQSPIAMWRVTVQGNTNVYDRTDTIFGLNGPFTFYVNNDSTNGNVFTTAIGDDANLGISSNAPKATLQNLLDSWDVDPEDTILIDTGHYYIDSNSVVNVRVDDQGNFQFPVTIRGSTNGIGTVMDGILLFNLAPQLIFQATAGFLLVEDLTFVNGVVVANGSNILFRNIRTTNTSVQISGAFVRAERLSLDTGNLTVAGNDSVVSNSVVRRGTLSVPGNRVMVEQSVVASTAGVMVAVSGVDVTIRNNTIIGGRVAIEQTGVDSSLTLINNILIANRAHHPNAQVISRLGGTLNSDYNLLVGRNGAWIGNADNGLWERLLYWQQRSRQDTNSFSADPLFANEAAGDYHLRSTAGRYENGLFVIDGVDSPAIDAGSPFSLFSAEPSPNGGRVNIGAYGNTPEASKSRTTPWLYAMTMNDGGVIRGTNIIRWLAGGMSPTNRVTLQYSVNAGSSWTTFASDVSALSGSYAWDTTTAPSSLDALWRVVLEADTNVWDQTDSIFNIRNDLRAFYVNNTTTNGNVFTTAPGNNANDGRTPSAPKASLENLLATYDTEPSDTIYVDTGVYTSSVIQVIWSRGGDSNANMTIRGSTNTAAGGTVIRRPAQAGDAMILQASYVTVRDMTFENAARGVFVSTNVWNILEEIEVRSNVLGVAVEGGGNHIVRSSRVWNNATGGVSIVSSSNAVIENITFVNNQPYGVLLTNAPNALIQNNIFYHDVASSNAMASIAGATVSVFNAFIDYNVYYFGPLAQSNTFINGVFTNLLTWQRIREKDYRSAMTNPLLHNVASGDFHLRSQAGRYDPVSRVFVNDAATSWAIDKGNPYSSFSKEPAINGGRVNVGAYGNTIYASKGSANPIVFNRTGNGSLFVTENENPYPLIWYLLNVPFDFNVTVQYSGDGGNDWITLQSGVPAYQEYILWTNSPTFNSFRGRWRIVGEGGSNTNYWDINDGSIRTFFGTHRISAITPQPGQAARIVWRGAWDEDYQIQFATNNVGTNRIHNWQNLVAVTNLVIGGDTPFIDAQASNDRFRVYRVIWLGTNGVPYQ